MRTPTLSLRPAAFAATFAPALAFAAALVSFAALAPPVAAQYEAALVADILPGQYGSSPVGLTVYDDRLFFRADDGEHGRELWSYDAATGEAVLVADINPGSGQSYPVGLTVYDGRLFFGADDGEHGHELWAYDAATDEATLINSEGPSNPWLTVYDGRLFFTADDGEHGGELWAYDAATGEATLAADIPPGTESSDPPRSLTVYDGRLFFAARGRSTNGGYIEGELWVYDAATGEATLADVEADIELGSGGQRPLHLTVYDGRLFFTADDGGHGREVWAYDGATGEAALAADIRPGTGSSVPLGLTVYDGRLFFTADNGFTDDGEPGREVWVYNAATGEAIPVTAFGDSQVHPGLDSVYDGRLFFTVADLRRSPSSYGLYFYDAATGEAARVGISVLDSFFADFTVYDGRLFFTTDDGGHGSELWVLAPVSVDDEPSAEPQAFALHAPHPNPVGGSAAGGSAMLEFTLAEPAPVRLAVYDVLGREVAVAAEGTRRAGRHEVRFDAAALPSGLYVVRLMAGGEAVTRRFTVVR
jgi:ELWxxDGT repeat protein